MDIDWDKARKDELDYVRTERDRIRTLLEALTQAAGKYVQGMNSAFPAKETEDEARRKLWRCIDAAYDYLQGPKTDD